MEENDNNNWDLKIDKLRKISAIIGIVELVQLLFIFILNLSYPNILLSLLGIISLALIFILSEPMYFDLLHLELQFHIHLNGVWHRYLGY